MVARKCYLAMLAMDKQVQTMNIEERRVVAEPTEALENIFLEENNPERCTRVGADLEEKPKQDLVHFLKPIRQKKRVFAPERDNAIKEEVQKLTTTKFIQ